MADKPNLAAGSGSTSPHTQSPSAPVGGPINYGGTVTQGSTGVNTSTPAPSLDAPVHMNVTLGNSTTPNPASVVGKLQRKAKQ